MTGYPGATALNNHGDVVGGGPAFLYRHSTRTVTQLGDGIANGINDDDVVVGERNGAAIVWQSGISTAFAAGTGAMGINDAGLIVGVRDNGYADTRAVYWDVSHVMTDIGSAGVSEADAVNDQGQIVGGSNFAGPFDGGYSAYIYENGVVTNLGTLPGDTDAAAVAISASGLYITGTSGNGQATHAFLLTADVMQDLGNLTGDPDFAAYGEGVNEQPEIVGKVQVDAAGTMHAFIVTHGRMHDLNELIGPSVITLTNAAAINCNGWIAATGKDPRDNAFHAYLLVRQGSWRRECPR